MMNGPNRSRAPRELPARQGEQRGDGPQRPPWVSMLWLALGVLLLIVFVRGMGPDRGDGAVVSYSRFRALVAADGVAAVTIRGQRLSAELRDTVRLTTEGGDTARVTRVSAVLPPFGMDALIDELESRSIEIRAEPTQGDAFWPMLLSWILPFLLLGLIVFVVMRRFAARGRGLLSIGSSRAKLYERQKERTTFQDVAGAQGAKEELREVVLFLEDPSRFRALGARVPKGVLLVGPPGTGKTLLARAVAGEAEVPFFSITGSDFMEMFVGVGASRVRDLFAQAKQAAPSIVFIDELDSIGRRRGAGLGGGHDEREQTLNQLLSELDGFEPTESVIVIAATNRPDILDPALLRPGRFDRRITVDLPTASDRRAILALHARGKPLADDVDLERVAEATPGLSGADLDNLLNEAALHAARADRDKLTMHDIDMARDRILMGLRRRGLALGEQELRILAHHEAGHAIVAAVLPHADPIHKVTIVPRGRSMGVTQQLPERERYIYERNYLTDRIAVMLGGRAAEAMMFQTATSGAENDLKQATMLARRMVVDWGMSDRLGPMASGDDSAQVFLGQQIARGRDFSDATARIVDEEILRILDEAHAQATDVLERNRSSLERAAALLLEEEEVSGETIAALIEDGQHEERSPGNSHFTVSGS